MSDEPPIVRRTDGINAHEGASQIEPDRKTCRAMVGRHFFGPDWQAGDERSLGGSQGDRRLREWRKLGYVLEARPPVTGSGPWDYRLGCHPSGGQLAEIRQHLTRLTGHPEAEAVRERLNKAHRRNGLSEWIADEALEDLRRI